MARSGVTALSLALILALVEFGSCLKCYQCMSSNDPSCLTLPTDEFLIDCDLHDAIAFNQVFLPQILPPEIIDGTIGSARFCHKLVLASGDVARTCLDGNAIKIDLSCMLIMAAANAATNAVPFKIPDKYRIKSCHVCDKNMCNAASSITASLPLGLLGLLASYVYIKQ